MKDSSPNYEYAGALLVSQEGALIVQHRDDNPNIQWPNSLSVFGGRLEVDETREAGLARELREETGLILKNYKHQFYTTVYQRKSKTPNVAFDVDCFIYIIKNVNPTDITLHEGRGIKILHSFSDTIGYPLSPTMEEVFKKYFTDLPR